MGEFDQKNISSPLGDDLKDDRRLKNPLGKLIWGRKIKEKQRAEQVENQDILTKNFDNLEAQMRKKLQHPQQHLTISFETDAHFNYPHNFGEIKTRVPPYKRATYNRDVVVVLSQNTDTTGGLTIAVYSDHYFKGLGEVMRSRQLEAIFSRDFMGYDVESYEDGAPYDPQSIKFARRLIEFVSIEAAKEKVFQKQTQEEKDLQDINQILQILPSRLNLKRVSPDDLNSNYRIFYKSEQGGSLDYEAMHTKEYYMYSSVPIPGTATLNNMIWAYEPVVMLDRGTSWQHLSKLHNNLDDPKGPLRGIAPLLLQGGFGSHPILETDERLVWGAPNSIGEAKATLIIEKNKATGALDRAILLAGGGYIPFITVEINLTDGIVTTMKSKFRLESQNRLANLPLDYHRDSFIEKTGGYEPQINLNLAARWFRILTGNPANARRELLRPGFEWPYNAIPQQRFGEFEGLDWILTERGIDMLREDGCPALGLKKDEIPEELLQAALDKVHSFKK